MIGNAYDTTGFIGMPNNTTIRAKYLKSVLVILSWNQILERTFQKKICTNQEDL